MKATHKVTCRNLESEYLVYLVGDTYYWRNCDDGGEWKGPFNGFEYDYVADDDWLVEKINTFKGNK